MLGSRHKRIRQAIDTMQPGTVFVISDFSDIASAKTASKTLTRLTDEGIVRKLYRGVYFKPHGAGSVPYPDDVAHALARSNTWHVAPSGETALHIFGLNKDRPCVWTYITDGTCRDYDIAGAKIVFQHASGKVLGAMSEKAALLVQVLKAYGKPHLSDDTLAKIRLKLKPSDFKRLLEETKKAPAWISKIVQSMLHRKELAND